jgi:hypothetical protein
MYPKNWTDYEDKIAVLRETYSREVRPPQVSLDCSIMRAVGPAAGHSKNLDDMHRLFYTAAIVGSARWNNHFC